MLGFAVEPEMIDLSGLEDEKVEVGQGLPEDREPE